MNRPYLLNVENGVEYVAGTVGADERLAPVSIGFLRRVKSGEIPLAEVRRIHRRGGDPEEVLGGAGQPEAARRRRASRSAELPLEEQQ